MAFDKVVDSAQLNAAMTYTAGRIREKTGETAGIPWNATKGFGDAIDAITAGSQKQIKVHTEAGAAVTATMGTQSVSGTAGTDGICLLDIPENGDWTVSAASGGMSGTSQVVTVTDVYDVSISLVSSTLNDNSWATIRAVSDIGEGANYWSVGDCKEVTLNGTVGALSLSNFTTYAFIIGFNHNAALEGDNRIHFQLAKTELSGGTDVCLCDFLCDSFSSSTAFSMNPSNTNSGGWDASFMRTEICGTDLTSYDGTIIAVIPDELRSTLKSATKYTDNTGNSSEAGAVTATTDFFFLLSEYEVFGTLTYANPNETSKQAQYSYYSAGNSKVKYKHDDKITASHWWLRSPRANSDTAFVIVRRDGTDRYMAAANSYGFAPGFCV